jgi:hypothetical protein
MLATILIVAMISLQTSALSLGLMVGRRFITAALSLNRKSAHSTAPHHGILQQNVSSDPTLWSKVSTLWTRL